jgi:hypothetical protein
MLGDNIRQILFVLLLCVYLLGCSIEGPPILSHSVPVNLPSSYTFSLPPDAIKSKIMSGLDVEVERDSLFYQKYGFQSGSYPGFEALLVEDKENASRGKTFFDDPANSECLYVYPMGATVQSAVYYTKKGPVGYAVEFAVSLKRQPNGLGTLVSVKSFNTQVFNGIDLLSGHGILYSHKNIPVAPVQAEEYKLLVYIAHLLGVSLQPLTEQG